MAISDWDTESTYNMTEYDEGFGTAYERFMMNDLFDRLVDEHSIRRVLEVPIYGTTGLTGINSVQFVRKGCSVTLVDSEADRIPETRRLWEELGLAEKVNLCQVGNPINLPFRDNSFDLVWNFAALWHIEDTPTLLSEMARVSSGLVLICVQNRMQPGYLVRKYVLDRDLFTRVHQQWLDIGSLKRVLERDGLQIIGEGTFDLPPFPDTAMPIGTLLHKIVPMRRHQKEQVRPAQGKRWRWSIMDYYTGRDPDLRRRAEKFMFIEKSPLPGALRLLWAHHRYIIGAKS